MEEKIGTFGESSEYVFGPICARDPGFKNEYIVSRTLSWTMCVGREGCFFILES